MGGHHVHVIYHASQAPPLQHVDAKLTLSSALFTMAEPEPPRPPPKRPYDSLFTPRQAPPVAPVPPRRPYDSLFTPGHGAPRLSSDAGRLSRAWHAFKYAGPPRLPPLTAKFASYIPIFLLLWKGNEWTMNEIMVYNHPAFVSDANGRLQWGGKANLFGIIGLVQEAQGGVAYARLKWAFNGANIIAASVSDSERLG